MRVKGRWTDLYRAVDKQGLTVDFLLSELRNIATAKLFFTQAIKRDGRPQNMTIDGSPARHTALSELKSEGLLPQQAMVRTSKYLNNLIEQDDRGVTQGIYPMLGFKRLAHAAITIKGIELAEGIRKGQFNTSQTIQVGVRVRQVWEAI